MSLSKEEMKKMYKQVVKELLLEEQALVETNERKKLDQYMEIIDALTFHELVDSSIEYEEEDNYFSLKLWKFPDNIQNHLKNKFKDELQCLNNQFKLLINPVKEFVDETRKGLNHRELDSYHLDKELKQLMKKKKVIIPEEEIITL